MFDFLLSATQAYNQVGTFAAALFCLCIGGLLLGNSLYWRIHAFRASGKITGVIPEGSAFFPVYAYAGPDGQTHYARSDTGSASGNGKQTGRVVRLLVAAHNPAEAREASDWTLELVGVVFFVPGLWLGHTALTAWPVTRMTWLMAIAFICYAGERFYKVVVPTGRRLSLDEWKQHHSLSSFDPAQVQPIEKLIAAAPESGSRQSPRGNTRLAVVVLALFGIVLLGAGFHQAASLYRLERSGIRTQGEVVRLVEKAGSGNSGPSYYPVVRFQTADRMMEFEDSIGSNPPTRRPGEMVAVLYIPGDAARPIIDRGIVWNWMIPGVLLAGACFALCALVAIIRNRLSSLPAGRNHGQAAA